MQILITGGTGLIGSHLIPRLFERHQITAYTRNVAMAERVLSHKITLTSSLDSLDNLNEFDAVINLAGEPIAEKRWSAGQKQRIERSRWDTTQTLTDLIRASDTPPSVFISGSAIGYYGRQDDAMIDETFDSPHDEFSHQLCKKWEDIALQVSDITRVCLLRTGIVLSKKGGALDKMLPLFRMGMGGPIGSGTQYMSWIHIDDMLNGILHLLLNEDCQGVYNFTAPNPVTNKTFAKTLGAQLGRPAFLPTPGFTLKLMFGEMSDLLLTGQRVIPQRLMQSGFEFEYSDVECAFAQLLK